MSTSALACAHCLRRSWLLAQLGPVLDYASGECGRMMDLLALEDAQLLTALGGSRRQELEARYARAALHEIAAAEGTQHICRHDRGYPAGLRGPVAARHQRSLRSLVQVGCAVSELPSGARARRAGLLMGARTVAGLASLMIVVEAEKRVSDLAGARLARELGRGVAAVPCR